MHTDHEDHREFFRIQDQVYLECSPIDGPEVELDAQQSTLFNLLADMHMLDYESQHLLRQTLYVTRTLRRRMFVRRCRSL